MLSPQEKMELESLRSEQGPINAPQAPSGGLSPQEKAELEQLRQEQQAPGLGSQMAEGGLSGLIPGRNTYKAITDPKKSGWDVAGAIGGDIAGVAGDIAAAAASGGGSAALMGAAKSRGAQGAFGLLNPLLQPAAELGGNAGAAIGREVGRSAMGLNPEVNYPSENAYGMNLLKQIPQELGRTAGELVPSGLAVLLGHGAYKAATKAPAPPIENAQIPKAEGLAKAGYEDVLTPSHLDSNDSTLRAMMDKNPGLAKEYTDRLGNAIAKDYGQTVQPPAIALGEEATGQLGAKYGGTFKQAMDAREQGYSEMMKRADHEIGKQTTGIGRQTHVGNLFAGRVKAFLKGEGIDADSIFRKTREGLPITEEDIPVRSSLTAEDVAASAKIADEAMRRAPSPMDLNGLIKKFTRSQKLFEGDPDAAAAFGRQVRKIGVGAVDEVLKKVDKMNVKQGYEPFYPQWEKMQSNWAQGADVVDKFSSNYVPRTDKSGVSINSTLKTPENIFKQDILAGGSNNIATLRKFLADNGQDGKVIEQMALDSLHDKAMKGGKFDIQKLDSEYHKIPVEQRNQLFKGATQGKIEAVIERGKQALGPTGPAWGMPTIGGSPTAGKLGFMNKLNDPLKARALGAGVGMAAGGLVGGPAGSMGGGALGGLLGDLAQRGAEARQFNTAKTFMSPNAKLIEQAKAAQAPSGPMLPWLRRLNPGKDSASIAAGRTATQERKRTR